jgi:glycosyltransferase involved in cell wall biosynthesis
LTLSIITPTYNSAATLRDTLQSVANQLHPQVEHIVVDGGSTDETLRIIGEYPHITRVISEPDEGLYDAINKGIQAASGDVIGILNSDDFFPHTGVLSIIAQAFEKNDPDCIYGDVVYVQADNTSKIVRYYSSKHFHPRKFAMGFMPAHPTFYLKKKYYERFGLHNLRYRIAADFELLLRMLYVHQLKSSYIEQALVHMRVGGVSNASLQNRLLINKEILQACQDHQVPTHKAKLYLRYFRKALEFVRRRKN